jgi:hypothetical protein
MPADSYWRLAPTPRYSLTLALPLLAAYEGLAAVVEMGPTPVRNGADVLLKSAFIALAGARGPLLFGAIVLGVGVWLVVRDVRRGKALRGRVFAGMALEAVAWSLLTGLVVGAATSQLLQRGAEAFATVGGAPLAAQGGGIESMPALTRLTVSLGAGLYEELLFRVLLTGGLQVVATRGLALSRGVAAVGAVVLSALVFSAFHYVGPYGDPFTVPSFTFRALAGVWFSALYVTRGFGITAWTHALYDVWLLV